MDVQTLVELYGLPGLIIAGLVWWGRMERQERIQERDSYRSRIDQLIDEASQREIEVNVTLSRIMDLLSRLNGGQ